MKIARLFSQYGNLIIFAFGFINAYVFIKTKMAIKKTEDMFNPRSDKVNGVSAGMQWDNKQISELKTKRKELLTRYAWYANITAIFPLLGILGTVASLVTYSDETMMENFMFALSTTLFGVLFAIIFKFIDAIISGPMDVIIDDADYVIHKYEEKRHGNEE